MVVFIVLLLVALFAGGERRKIDKYFALVIAGYLIVLMLMFSLYMFRLYGNKDKVVSKYLYAMILGALIASNYFVCEYCAHYFRPNDLRLKKIVRRGIFPVTLVVSIAGLFGIIFDQLYVIEKNVISLKPPFIAYYVLYFALAAFSLGVCFYKTKRTKMETFAFILLTVGMPLALLFEYLYIDNAILAACLVSFFLIHFLLYYTQKGKQVVEQQKLLQDQQNNLMISQIQPHFIYNCLSSISYLCEVDGKRASEAINDFSKYLRMNFSTINIMKLVPFEKELEYIDAYLKLEKLRFGDKVNIKYELECRDFLIPCLSIQPLVENAVKHGITKKIKGGTITLKTYELGGNIIVIIKDDGVGYDINKKHEDERVHVGIVNTRNRIEKMCNGTFIIKSKENEGTTITISLPKQVVKMNGGGEN